MTFIGQDSFKTRASLKIQDQVYHYFSLEKAEKHLPQIHRLPRSLKILLENLLRFEDGKTVTTADLHALQKWTHTQTSDHEIAYRPARVLMQDFTGVPAIVDLAAMREALRLMQSSPHKISPLNAVDLIIDHSVMVDQFGHDQAFHRNTEIEMQRNHERYAFLRWGQTALKIFGSCRLAPAFVIKSILNI